jgi:hypothetical protein
MQAVGAHVVDHARVLVASLGRVARHPLSTLMTVAVIGIALALPAGLHLVVANGRTLSGHWEGAAELSVFMRADVPLVQVEGHAKSLRSDPAIGEVTLIARHSMRCPRTRSPTFWSSAPPGTSGLPRPWSSWNAGCWRNFPRTWSRRIPSG